MLAVLNKVLGSILCTDHIQSILIKGDAHSSQGNSSDVIQTSNNLLFAEFRNCLRMNLIINFITIFIEIRQWSTNVSHLIFNWIVIWITNASIYDYNYCHTILTNKRINVKVRVLEISSVLSLHSLTIHSKLKEPDLDWWVFLARNISLFWQFNWSEINF